MAVYSVPCDCHVAVVDLTVDTSEEVADEEEEVEEEEKPQEEVVEEAPAGPSRVLVPSRAVVKTSKRPKPNVVQGDDADEASKRALAEFSSTPFSCDALFACKFGQAPLPMRIGSLPVPFKGYREASGAIHATREQVRAETCTTVTVTDILVQVEDDDAASAEAKRANAAAAEGHSFSLGSLSFALESYLPKGEDIMSAVAAGGVKSVFFVVVPPRHQTEFDFDAPPGIYLLKKASGSTDSRDAFVCA